MINFLKNKNNNDVDNSLIKITALLIHAAKIDENYTEKERKIIREAIVELDSKDNNIDELVNFLSSKNIETRTLYPPLHTQKYLADYVNVDVTSSLESFEKYLWLPSSTKLTNEEIDYISSTLNSFQLHFMKKTESIEKKI